KPSRDCVTRIAAGVSRKVPTGWRDNQAANPGHHRVRSGRSAPQGQPVWLGGRYRIQPTPELRIRRVGEDVCHPHPPQTRTCRIPASGSSQESLANGDIAMDDPGPRKRVAGEEGSELLPWEWCRAGPSLQPFPPGPFSLEGILEQLPNVPRDTVVRVVTSQLLRQPLVLLGYWEVAVGPTPFLYCEQRASKSAFGRPLPYHVHALL